MLRLWILGIVCILAAGCGDDKAPGAVCNINADCQRHELCYDGYCVAVKCPEPPESYKGLVISATMCDPDIEEGNTPYSCCPYIGEDCLILLCCNQMVPENGYYKYSEKCE